jgi:ADP-heptose:LPS heptosyltransferase
LEVAGVERIVLFRALHLGDFLCSVPALRALRRRFPNAEITLIGLPWAREVVDRFPYVDAFVEFPGYRCLEGVDWSPARSWDFFQQSRSVGYDLAIQMHGDGSKSNGFVARLGARATLGYRPPQGGRLGLLDLELQMRPREHEIIRCLRLVEPLGAVGSTELEFRVTMADWLEIEAVAERLGLDLMGPVIGVHPGAKTPDKRWPVERFAATADRLATELGAQVVVTGSADELPLAQRVASSISAPAFIAAGETSIGGLAALLAAMKLLVTNDTGVSHLAAAVRTPSVVLFGPTDPARWAPLDGRRHRALAPGRGNLISSIPVKRVVEESLSLVERWVGQMS